MSPSHPSIRPDFAAALGIRREESPRPPLPAREAALVGLTAFHLCFLPWALGAVHLPSQLISLGLSFAGFALALWPERNSNSSSQDRTREPALSLLRWPFFWAGLAMLAYIAVQGLNPSWRFVSDSHSWWLVPVGHATWLPSGVEAPFARSNPWRGVLVGGSLWLLVCSVRVGFLRRQGFRALFSLLVVNAALIALLGMAQHLTGTSRIFWTYQPSNPAFAASFIYPNHAGAYLNLTVGLGVGLGWWHFRRYRRLLENPALALMYGFLAALIGLMVIMSASRMSILLLGLFLIVIAGVFLAKLFRRKSVRGQGRSRAVAIAALAGCLAVAAIALRSDAVLGRFKELASDPANTLGSRAIARKAAEEMLADRWLLGWGAGCFQYGFPLYARHHPEIYNYASGLRQFWEHAHDDLLEIPIELGAAGLLPLVAALGFGARRLWRRKPWRNPISLCIGLGCALTVAHAGFDFVFQCPAILLTWSVVLLGAARWPELNPPTGSTREPGVASPA